MIFFIVIFWNLTTKQVEYLIYFLFDFLFYLGNKLQKIMIYLNISKNRFI